jgi:hypothetical protein
MDYLIRGCAPGEGGGQDYCDDVLIDHLSARDWVAIISSSSEIMNSDLDQKLSKYPQRCSLQLVSLYIYTQYSTYRQ